MGQGQTISLLNVGMILCFLGLENAFFLPGPKLQEFAICNSFIWLGKTRYFGLFLHFVGKYWEFGSWVAPSPPRLNLD